MSISKERCEDRLLCSYCENYFVDRNRLKDQMEVSFGQKIICMWINFYQKRM